MAGLAGLPGRPSQPCILGQHGLLGAIHAGAGTIGAALFGQRTAPEFQAGGGRPGKRGLRHPGAQVGRQRVISLHRVHPPPAPAKTRFAKIPFCLHGTALIVLAACICYFITQTRGKPAPSPLARGGGCAHIRHVASATMDINALVISGSDPGAVPGGSTKLPSFADHGAETGSTNV